MRKHQAFMYIYLMSIAKSRSSFFDIIFSNYCALGIKLFSGIMLLKLNTFYFCIILLKRQIQKFFKRWILNQKKLINKTTNKEI